MRELWLSLQKIRVPVQLWNGNSGLGDEVGIGQSLELLVLEVFDNS